MYFEIGISYGDGGYELLYSPTVENLADNRVVYDIRPIVVSLNKAGSFGFTVPKVNPAWDNVQAMMTQVAVFKNGGKCIFRGRVDSVTTDTYSNKIVTCECAFAFLNDIIVEPFIYSGLNGDDSGTYVSPDYHMQHLMNIYGSYCSENRVISFNADIGGDSKLKSSDMGYMGITDFITVREGLMSVLDLDPFGFFKMHYEDMRLEYREKPLDSLAFVELGKNIVEYSINNSPDDIFTVVTFVGKDGIILPNYRHVELNNTAYGNIHKVIHVDNARNDAEARPFVEAWMAAHTGLYPGGMYIPQIEVTAVDLGLYGTSSAVEAIDVGSRIEIRGRAGTTMLNQPYMCSSMSLDIVEPENSTYTLDPCMT